MTSTDWKVRRLHPQMDAALWREIRLEALKVAPTAFASRHAEWKDRPLRDFSEWLNGGYYFAAVAGERALGIVGWTPISHTTTRHRGQVVSVFVRPEARRQGVGDALFDAVVAHAKMHVRQLELGVGSDNAPARALYERKGFSVTGTHPRAYCHDGVFQDELFMVRALDE